MRQRGGFKAGFSLLARRSGEKSVLTTALFKTRKNLILGREDHPLTPAENKSLYRDRPFKTTYWIEPDKIVYGVGSEKKALIVYGGIGPLDIFAQQVTSVFIRELVQRKSLEETTLYKRMLDERLVRPVILGGKRVKIPLNSHENMNIYFEQCHRLIKSIKEKGFEGSVERSTLENIGLAVTSDGRITHYRVGNHRLAIAQALGIKTIPMDILLVSAKFLVERLSRWQLWSSSVMVRAVDGMLRDTVAKIATFLMLLGSSPV